MVRDADARGVGPLRRGNPETPDTGATPAAGEPQEIVAPSVVPPLPDDIEQTRPLRTAASDRPPVPGTRAAAAAAAAWSRAQAPASGSADRPTPAIALPPVPTPPAPGPSAPPTPAVAMTPPTPPVPSAPPASPPLSSPAPTQAPAPAATSAPTPAPAPAPEASASPAASASPSSADTSTPSPTLAPAPTPAQAPAQAPTPAQAQAQREAPTPAPAPARIPSRDDIVAPPAPPAPRAAPADSAAAPHASSSSRRQQREQGVERRSFLQDERREEPARRGARGLLNRVGFSLGPDSRERAVRDDEHAVSRHWPGPRTVAIVNGKGGAGKTPATVLLSAVFAQYGGAGVLAWDNNQTRGTLGWRTETGAHDRTLLELLPQTQRLLGAQGQSADLAHFVHHQPQEKYDVLRSKPIRLAHENRLSPTDVDAIHAVAAKFYRLIIIDSGNDESDPMWLRMIDLADQIVVATTTRDDHAEAGALLLEALEDRDERSARLARESVVVVSQADPKASAADVSEVVAGYRSLAREVVDIPFDREMVDGHLRLRALAAPTQRAWLSAAAAVARGF
ncbi:MinD-like ATPase involved in chromosome partitioning or flagellar assembly [Microbacterium foliorum]|uniref:MinD/ParA family ATP-binding protein n=1 Tax=Microbacterium foliorum TaxID=104336 RepID=UPI0020A10753|nr:AAA family ATPase [Microbacterium foliorum]MCP1430504.1 MinD-like ATPase involved in chromosome partitioning or flagellar assembly [Microbacterium foliorum]